MTDLAKKMQSAIQCCSLYKKSLPELCFRMLITMTVISGSCFLAQDASSVLNTTLSYLVIICLPILGLLFLTIKVKTISLLNLKLRLFKQLLYTAK